MASSTNKIAAVWDNAANAIFTVQTILTARGKGRGENISLPEHGAPCMDLERKAASFHTFFFGFVSLRIIFHVLLLFKLLFFFFLVC